MVIQGVFQREPDGSATLDVSLSATGDDKAIRDFGDAMLAVIREHVDGKKIVLTSGEMTMLRGIRELLA